jgi:hypothetical protein
VVDVSAIAGTAATASTDKITIDKIPINIILRGNLAIIFIYLLYFI